MGKEGYVSIQAVNDMLEYCRNFDGNDAIYIFEKWFREQEPVQPKMGSSSENPNKWIPVSERLPEEAGMYLCSYDDDYVGTSYFDIRMNEFNIFHEQVIAWMYIPEPYQPEIPTGQIVANGELYPGEFDNPLAEEGSEKE